MRNRTLPWILLGLLLIPSANYHLFDGLPLSSLAELGLLALLLPVLVSSSLRRLIRRSLGPVPGLARGLTYAGLAAVLVKIGLLLSGTFSGFLGCYRSPLAIPERGRCETAYANPFYRWGVTRLDRELAFDQGRWNLSFVNSSRFNFYAWEEGTISRERLPIQADWQTTLNGDQVDQLTLAYVGEGSLTLGGRTIALEPSYAEIARIQLSVDAVPSSLEIHYAFDDGYRVGDESPPGPQPFLELSPDGLDGGIPETLAFGEISLGWLIAGWLVDAVLIAAGLALVAFYLLLLRRAALVVLVFGVLGALVYRFAPEQGLLTKERALLLCLGALLLWLAARRRPRRLLGVYLALCTLVVIRSLLYQPDLRFVSIRPGGTDPLTYESQAHSILDDRSLRAGEDLFFGQVFFRYILFGEHLLFGDPDAFVAIPALVAINLSVYYLFARWNRHTRRRSLQMLLAVLSGGLALALLNSWHAVYFVHYGASEYPTWPLALFGLTLLFSERPARQSLGSALLAVDWITRTNHAPALLLLLAAYLIWRQRKGDLRSAALPVGIFIAVLLLPGLHNLIYGGRFIPYPTYWDNRTNMVLPPWLLIREIGDAGTRQLALNQVKGLLTLNVDLAQYFGVVIAMRAILLLWAATVVLAWLRRKQINFLTWVLLAAPLAYLAVQFFYAIFGDLYPRHLVMPYLMMAAGSLIALSPGVKRLTVQAVQP